MFLVPRLRIQGLDLTSPFLPHGMERYYGMYRSRFVNFKSWPSLRVAFSEMPLAAATSVSVQTEPVRETKL